MGKLWLLLFEQAPSLVHLHTYLISKMLARDIVTSFLFFFFCLGTFCHQDACDRLRCGRGSSLSSHPLSFAASSRRGLRKGAGTHRGSPAAVPFVLAPLKSWLRALGSSRCRCGYRGIAASIEVAESPLAHEVSGAACIGAA